ncbi:MAG TPA: integration host factor subunit alpha, partial [Ruminococcaceae bacterium]|nr:integration host factor subunit alpha [Oscillospiraceae bacterium]
MTKTELVSAISEKTEMTKKDSEKIISAFVEAVTEALEKGEKVQLV